MLENYVNKIESDLKYLKMYFDELKGAFAKVNAESGNTQLAKDKITYCLNKIEDILGE